jgi:hypothetical protein
MSGAAHREDALLRPRALLVASRAADRAVVAPGIKRLLQRLGLHHPVVGDAVMVERIDVLTQPLRVGVDAQVEPEARGGRVTERDHVPKLPGRVDVQQGKRRARRIERLEGQVQEDRGVLADRVEHHRALGLGGGLA